MYRVYSMSSGNSPMGTVGKDIIINQIITNNEQSQFQSWGYWV